MLLSLKNWQGLLLTAMEMRTKGRKFWAIEKADNRFKRAHVFTTPLPGKINRHWILLNNQSTIGLFCNLDLLEEGPPTRSMALH